MAKILVVDHEPEHRSALRTLFERLGHGVSEAADGKKALSSACIIPCDLVVLDLNLPKRAGTRALKVLAEECPELPVLATVEPDSRDIAVQALKLGAFAYVTKPFNNDEVRIAAERSLERAIMLAQNDYLLGQLKERHNFDRLVGTSQEVKEACTLAKKAAKQDCPVLIRGENGTGKERLAKVIHYQSGRAGRPFVKVACAAMSDECVETELIGGGRGTASTRRGCLGRARGGTLFLNEVTALPLPAQTKLLEILRSGESARSGEGESLPCDIRIICSTTDSLEAGIEKKGFSRELCEYLSSCVISLPPIRERQEDIPPLVRHFIDKYSSETGRRISSITDAAMAQIMAGDWHGNVGELENCIERSVIHCDGDCIQPAHITLNISGKSSLNGRKRQSLKSLRDIERDHIRKVLIQCNWNKSAAAAVLEVDRKTLRAKIREFGFIAPSEAERNGHDK